MVIAMRFGMLLAYSSCASLEVLTNGESKSGLEQMKRLGSKPRRVTANARVRESSDSGTALVLVRPGHSNPPFTISFATGNTAYPLAAFPKSPQPV